MAANDRQVGGKHYQSPIQHWDFVVANDLDYFQGQITKYVTRWKQKGGIDDLEKARHFLDKYLEVAKAGHVVGFESRPEAYCAVCEKLFEDCVCGGPGRGYVNQI